MINENNSNKISSSICSNCIMPTDINPTFKSTFEFIKNTLPSNSVTILMKISLLQTETSFNPLPINIATNTFVGDIKEVYDTYLTLSYPSLENEEIEYTISYNGILDLYSSTIYSNFEKYVEVINNLNPLCSVINSDNLDVLIPLSDIISDPDIYPGYNIVLVLSGSFTREFSLASLCILSNLIVAEKFIIFPATEISGFILKPPYDVTS